MGRNLKPKSDITLPVSEPAEKMRQITMLKVRKPCDGWQTEPEAKELGDFKDNIDIVPIELRPDAPVRAGRNA